MLKSIIVARAENFAIGKENALLWRLPRDMRHFRSTTMGHHVIVGRKTYESIGGALPGRSMIVVTRNVAYEAPGCTVVSSLGEALACAEGRGEGEVMIAGGAQIYEAALPLADRVYLTVVEATLAGDAFFPALDPRVWEAVSRGRYPADEHNAYGCHFWEMRRVGGGIGAG